MNSIQSALLRLPGELRNKIYGHVLGGHVIKFFFHDGSRRVYTYKETGELSTVYEEREDVSPILQLGLVCRQIRSETILLPYKTNTFYFTSLQALQHLCQNITPARGACITEIALSVDIVRDVIKGDKIRYLRRRHIRKFLPNLQRLILPEKYRPRATAIHKRLHEDSPKGDRQTGLVFKDVIKYVVRRVKV